MRFSDTKESEQFDSGSGNKTLVYPDFSSIFILFRYSKTEIKEDDLFLLHLSISFFLPLCVSLSLDLFASFSLILSLRVSLSLVLFFSPAWLQGDPRKVIYPTDSYGQFCGQKGTPNA